MRASQNELARNRTTPDFHIELLRLRQNWRLKKVSNSIIGDLSYRTGMFSFAESQMLAIMVSSESFLKLYIVVIFVAGSKYAQTGMFEVTKAEEEPQTTGSPPPSPGPGTGAGPPKSSSALRVTVPSELQGVAYIEVLCQKG